MAGIVLGRFNANSVRAYDNQCADFQRLTRYCWLMRNLGFGDAAFVPAQNELRVFTSVIAVLRNK